MVTANKILNLAAREIGTLEKNNHIKYNTTYYQREVSGSSFPYCCVFVWWIFRQANAAKLFFDGERTAYCPTLVSWFKKKGLWHNNNFKPGDIVFFDWDGKGIADHVGFVEQVSNNGTITTIEGNTENPANPSQEGVFRRTRYAKQILGAGRPNYQEDNEMTKAEIQEMLKDYVTKETYSDLINKLFDENAQPSLWAEKEWIEAKELGLCDGTRPKAFITREQAAAMALRAYKLGKKEA